MKVLITGASGMLGQDMVTEFHGCGCDVIAMNHCNLDITDLKQVNQVIKELRPHLVVNCAAYTDVDRAEFEPQKAYLVNGLGPRNLVLASREIGAGLVQISTDYVFSGEQDRPYGVFDVAKPLNVYGASKLWGERAVLELSNRNYLIRTSWLFGCGGKNFVSTMIRLGQEGKPIKVVDDQLGCPTFTEDLSRAVVELVQTGCYGTYHVTNQNPTTWLKFAESILAICKCSVKLIPCTTREMDRPARRPGFSVLDPFPLKETIGYLLPDWDDALRRYLVKKGELMV